MIFKDKLTFFDKSLKIEFDNLFKLALKNQLHSGDLLLLHMNGFYDETMLTMTGANGEKYSPYCVGPSDEGHSETAHYNFIHKYRTTYIYKDDYPDYLKLHEWSMERRTEIEELVDFEETSIQLEMLVYLKCWEADMIIKKLYQFVRLIHGEPYDWAFKIQESSRGSVGSGSRQDIIRLKIRDRLKNISPNVYKGIKESYKTQIRNSIAHSNYSFQGRQINLNNMVKEDPHAQMYAVTFDDWVDIFHYTLCLNNHYIRLNNIISEHYAKKGGQMQDILLPDQTIKVVYRPEWNDWVVSY